MRKQLNLKFFVVCTILAVMATSAFAQEQGVLRGSFNLGYAIPQGGGGVALDGQVGYNIQNNMTIGLRLGGAALMKIDPFGENSIGLNANYLATYTYFFHAGSGTGFMFAPFLGGGVGVYHVAAMSAGSDVHVDAGARFGGMITAGVEISRFRLAVEYNLVPSSAVRIDSNAGVTPNATSVRNSYLAITFGYVLSRESWGRR